MNAYRDLCSKCRKCEKFRNHPLRPFTLEYLALATVLRNNICRHDKPNEIQQNPEIFKNKKYTKRWKKWHYDVFKSLYFNPVPYIVYWLSQTVEVRDSHDFQMATAKPFCRCQEIGCIECLYSCYDGLRRQYSHTKKCKQTF